MPGDTIYRTGDLARLREDEAYEFIGRKDSQVKWLGYRIELGEIEKALLSVQGIHDAAVIFDTSDDGESRQGIVAFAELETDKDAAAILTELKQRLPEYMLPRAIVRVESLPRTDRGKVDRTALKRLVDSAPAGMPAQDNHG